MAIKLNIPFKYIKPILFKIDPEKAHSLTMKALKMGLHPAFKPINDERLKVDFCGHIFPNPVGVSAGFDKNAEVIEPMLKMGFGFIEAGGVTIPPQKGLPKPRIFRDIQNEAIINKMNFPNKGMESFKNNTAKFYNKADKTKGILGVQIAMTSGQTEPEKDFKILIKNLGAYADYMVFNISCPNTPGLRNLEKKENFKDLAQTLIEHRNKIFKNKTPPLLAKFSPDLEPQQLKDIAEACVEIGIDGVVLANTTTTRPDYLPEKFRQRQGGLSGKPLTDKSTEIIRQFYALTKGKIPIIGVGGISSGQDAYNKIKAGASLVQLYSALVYHGPEIANQINQDLLKLLEKDGYTHLSQAVGSDHKDLKQCA